MNFLTKQAIMKIDKVFLDKFNELKKDFAANLPLRLNAIEETLQDFMMQPESEDRLHALHRLLHSLGGTAGSFGFAQIGLDARKIEGQVVALSGCRSRRMEDLVLIAKAVAELKGSANLCLNMVPESISQKHVEMSDVAVS